MSHALRLRQFFYSIFASRFIELQRGQAIAPHRGDQPQR
jgi:hypothetical protein